MTWRGQETRRTEKPHRQPRSAELETTSTELAALDDDIDAQYERLRDTHTGNRAAPDERTTVDIEDAVLSTVCSYGPMLKSVPRDQHLTIAVEQGGLESYYVFGIDAVKSCEQRSGGSALLANAYTYQR